MVNDCNINADSYCNIGHSYEEPHVYKHGTDEAKCYLAGSHHFSVAEIEIFKVNLTMRGAHLSYETFYLLVSFIIKKKQ